MARALNTQSSSSYVGTESHRLQLQLGQITEMIHVASLIHDDVLDEAGSSFPLHYSIYPYYVG
jgi:geranylgeranyl pyrophosphate synthase